MTDEELLALLKQWAKDYCNNKFEDADGNEVLPAGVEIFLDRAISFIKSQEGVQSESLGDHSITYLTDLPDSLLRMLRPYKKVAW